MVGEDIRAAKCVYQKNVIKSFSLFVAAEWVFMMKL